MKIETNIDGEIFTIDTDNMNLDDCYTVALGALEAAWNKLTGEDSGRGATPADTTPPPEMPKKIYCKQCEQEIFNDQTAAEASPVWVLTGWSDEPGYEKFVRSTGELTVCPLFEVSAPTTRVSRYHVPA